MPTLFAVPCSLLAGVMLVLSLTELERGRLARSAFFLFLCADLVWWVVS